LRAASVFGTSFPGAGVAVLVGSAAEIDRPLAEAIDREVVVRRHLARPGHDAEYAFRHLYLRDAAYATLTGEDRLRGHRLAGRWLAARGDLEAAAAHYASAHDFGALAALVRAQAEGLARDGHHATLRDLLARLPDTDREADPWLLYWSGVAAAPTDPLAARAPFERAYQSFLAAGDAAGAFLGWAGVVDSFFFDPTGVAALDRWYDELERLRLRWPTPPSAAMEARVAATLFSVSARRFPRGVHVGEWERRALALLESEPSGFLLAPGLVIHFLFLGAPGLARRVVDTVRPRVAAGSLAALYVDNAECFQLWQAGEFEAAERMAAAGQRTAHSVGLHGLGFFFGSVRFYVACDVGNHATARAIADEGLAAIPPGHRMMRAHVEFNACWQRLVSGDFDAAIVHGREAVRGAVESGTTTGEVLARVALAEALIERGQLDEAEAEIAPIQHHADETGSRQLAYFAGLLRAHLHDAAGRHEACLAELRPAFALARESDLTLAAWSAYEATTRRLCRIARDAGIEAETVERLARRQGIGLE
jgi:hypothetical protein